jgi:manganese-dependent ADP-ribose/CDP-alcohol diphosphatase
MLRKLLVIPLILSFFGCNSFLSDNRKKDSFSFGIVADIQYADKDTRKGGKRNYRKSMDCLKKCVEELNQQKPDFVIQLGDIIDGNRTKQKTIEDLDNILEVYNKLEMPKYHVVGNHCMKSGGKVLKEKLGLEGLYYDFTVPEAPGWRFIVLFGLDAGYGVMSETQLDWLKGKLEKTVSDNEKVIIFNHYPLLKKAAGRYIMRNPKPVLDIINSLPQYSLLFCRS